MAPLYPAQGSTSRLPAVPAGCATPPAPGSGNPEGFVGRSLPVVALPAVVALVEAPPAPVTDEVGPGPAPVVDAAALAPVVVLPIPPKGPCVVTPPVGPEVVVGPPAADAVFTVALCVVGAVVFDKPVVDPL